MSDDILKGIQIEILRLVAQNKTNAEIGAILGKQEVTIKVLLHDAFERLSVHGRHAAVIAARSHGLLPLVNDDAALRARNERLRSRLDHVLEARPILQRMLLDAYAMRDHLGWLATRGPIPEKTIHWVNETIQELEGLNKIFDGGR